MNDAIDAGALVEVELVGEPAWFLLVPAAGGTVIHHEGMEITLLTPASPLYRKLVSLRIGDSLETPALTVTEVV